MARNARATAALVLRNDDIDARRFKLSSSKR
jgi:hypothetical protein